MKRRWFPPTRYTFQRNIAGVMKDLVNSILYLYYFITYMKFKINSIVFKNLLADFMKAYNACLKPIFVDVQKHATRTHSQTNNKYQ